MGNKVVIVLLAFISFAALFLQYQQTAICRNPLGYSLGNFDTRFGITEDKFINTVKAAESTWEKGIGRELFQYNSSAPFKVNLIFNERQAVTIEAVGSERTIETSRASYDALVREYNNLVILYKQRVDGHNFWISQFEQRLAEYNRKVAHSNSKGGASPDEYDQLQQERKALEAQKTELDKKGIDLNALAARINGLGDQVNSLAQRLNLDVKVHNRRYGEPRKFDQAEYRGNEINIYQFDGISDLQLVLAHEFGHALGLDHVNNPVSMMYYLMDKQNLMNPQLSQEDIAAFKTRCRI